MSSSRLAFGSLRSSRRPRLLPCLLQSGFPSLSRRPTACRLHPSTHRCLLLFQPRKLLEQMTSEKAVHAHRKTTARLRLRPKQTFSYVQTFSQSAQKMCGESLHICFAFNTKATRRWDNRFRPSWKKSARYVGSCLGVLPGSWKG